ncbi:isoflavone reductase family [Pyrenophora seminiperda CCB06]|uniref:Isoflavone reductase family n=1 Tax=Pyrenophora seminiperda CCB06 TaxID=1302712 RepID=A0A3M7M2X3_9PLEO|nr:isoflavone reductase family [Pyrenophora seminiperda CCB06]
MGFALNSAFRDDVVISAMMINTCLDLALLCHPYFLFSFLVLLGIRYASSTPTAPHVVQEVARDLLCQSQDQPNPIASVYPNNATGTLNGTISVLPISLELARELIPSKYKILEHAYRHLLPTFPEGMYPAILQAVHDHGVQASGFQIADFSRAGIEFPFLDLLGDNSTSFKWAPSLLMSADNAIALKGAADYGTNIFPATFEPSCDAYRAVPDAKEAGTTFFSADSLNTSAASITTEFSVTDEESLLPLSFFMNVTNQVMFADGKSCDNMIRLFNTSVTTSPNKIERVKGTVRAKILPFKEDQYWQDACGIRLDTSFIENNYLPCENFRGYGDP